VISTEDFSGRDDGRSQSTNGDPQLDEAVWNAWVKKNETRDKIRFARSKKIVGIILVLGFMALLVWKFTG
jgi:hypothetical protein